jgi:GNAT superfamily N-acetyltransferase
MYFREATIQDIKELHVVRLSVRENVLNNPLLVTEADYTRYLSEEGRGWLCEMDQVIAGFAILDSVKNNIWALFIRPQYEKRGIGKKLQEMMLDWHFSQSHSPLWLSTAPGTRAETFYRRTGWSDAGLLKNGERKFEMTHHDWGNRNK